MEMPSIELENEMCDLLKVLVEEFGRENITVLVPYTWKGLCVNTGVEIKFLSDGNAISFEATVGRDRTLAIYRTFTW